MPLEHTWVNQTDAAVDEKLGLISIKLPFTVSPGASKIATLNYALTFLPPELAAVGLPMVKRDVKERSDCGYDVSFNFDGVFEPQNAEGEEFSLDGSTNDEKVEAHPEIAALVAQWYPGKTLANAADDKGEIIFPATLKDGGDSAGAPSFFNSVSPGDPGNEIVYAATGGPSDPNVIPNPMHGVRTFLDGALVWNHSWVSLDYPPGLERQLGCIGTPPSGRLGQTPPPGREWILAKLTADWRGNIWKFKASWLQSGRGGFPPVYRYR